MYKVFVNDCPLFLTDQKNISTSFKKINFDECNILEIVQLLFQKKLNGIYLICSDIDKCFESFKKHFRIQEAAGGKVLNANNEVLFIYRFNKWDLPKGKLEKGESIEQCAIREVEEECGIDNLEIKNKLETTYHLFERRGKIVFKITYWFLMNSTFNGDLKPQLEEDISIAAFKNEAETVEALHNTYANIRLLFS